MGSHLRIRAFNARYIKSKVGKIRIVNNEVAIDEKHERQNQLSHVLKKKCLNVLLWNGDKTA